MDTTAQVTRLDLRAKWKIARARQLVRSAYSSLKPTISSKISPSHNCHFIRSRFRFTRKADTVSQVFRTLSSLF